MTVKELINKLKFCNQEAEVVMYHFNNACDGAIEYIKEIHNITDDKVLHCNGDSIVEEEFLGENIVYIVCN